MKALTYEAWQEAGYQVKRGERASARDPRSQKALFTRDQVEERNEFDRQAGLRFEREE